MAFDINKFTAEINDMGGVLRNNKFKVTMPIPNGLASNSHVTDLSQFNAIQRKLEFWCEAANLPGTALASSEIRRYGMGVAEKKPYAPILTDVQLVFRADARGLIHAYLHNWMRIAVCYQNGPGALSQLMVGPLRNQHLWEVGYKDDYKVQTEITTYDDRGGEAIKVTLRDSYPLFVGDMSFNWAARGEYSRIPVTLTFFDWYTHGLVAVNESNIGQVSV